MTNKHQLTAQTRKIVGRKVRRLRKDGLIPANIFGKSVDSMSIQVKSGDFAKVYAQVGESTLLYLQVEGESEPHPVLVREVTHHPLTGLVLHVDFNQVNLKEKVTAPVEVKLVDEAPAEQEKLGILVQQLDEVEVEAYPADMPENMAVSVANLKAVGDTILVKDITVDSKVTIMTDPEEIVAKIEALAKEEVVEAPVAAVEPVAGEATPTTAEPAPAASSDQPK